jgi:hypothetical protein
MDEEYDLDLDLLLSVTSGIGKWEYIADKRVYAKDVDCIGELDSGPGPWPLLESHLQGLYLSRAEGQI